MPVENRRPRLRSFVSSVSLKHVHGKFAVLVAVSGSSFSAKNFSSKRFNQRLFKAHIYESFREQEGDSGCFRKYSLKPEIETRSLGRDEKPTREQLELKTDVE